MHKSIRKLPVIGQQNEPGCFIVESSYGIYLSFDIHQVYNGSSPVFIGNRGDHIYGFVQGNVNIFRANLDGFTVNFYFVFVRVYFIGRKIHRNIIYRHSSLLNVLVRGAAGNVPVIGDEFIQPDLILDSTIYFAAHNNK